MRITTKFGWIVAALAVTLWPGIALAQNDTCNTAANMGADDVHEFAMSDAIGNNQKFFVFPVATRRSYCVEVLGDASENTQWDSDVEVFNGPLCPLIIGSSDDDNREPGLASGSRVCFVAAVGGAHAARAFPFPGSAPVNQSFDIRVIETTLSSPYWQVVTASGYDAAPQIRNTTSSAIDVLFTTYNAAGVPTGCNQTPITIPGNGLSTFGISSTCGISSGFGSAQIAHTGPPGAVTANITTFSAMSGLSFDAAFHPRQKNNPVN